MYCSSSAVVSSSSLLLTQRQGIEIDNNQCVFRLGHAPTMGYEEFVGNRTTHRIVGPAVLHMLADRYRNDSMGRGVCTGCETIPESEFDLISKSQKTLCRDEACIFLHKTSLPEHRQKDLKILAIVEPRVLSLSMKFSTRLISWVHCTKTLKDRQLFVGGGLAALVIARRITRGAVVAYGFECGNGCCNSGRPYHYYSLFDQKRCCQHLESNSEGPILRRLEQNNTVVFKNSNFTLCGRSRGISCEPWGVLPATSVVSKLESALRRRVAHKTFFLDSLKRGFNSLFQG